MRIEAYLQRNTAVSPCGTVEPDSNVFSSGSFAVNTTKDYIQDMPYSGVQNTLFFCWSMQDKLIWFARNFTNVFRQDTHVVVFQHDCRFIWITLVECRRKGFHETPVVIEILPGAHRVTRRHSPDGSTTTSTLTIKICCVVCAIKVELEHCNLVATGSVVNCAA